MGGLLLSWRTSRWVVAVALLALVTACEEPPTTAELIVHNRSESSLGIVRYQSVGTDAWSDNLLSAPLAPDRSVSATVDKWYYTVELTTLAGAVYEFEVLDLTGTDRFVLELR